MRLLRNKRNRKTLEFFRLAFGARPPYKVLVDGNFIAQAVSMQQDAAFERLIQQLLGDTTFLHVTDCVVAELVALGAPAARALAAARTLSTIRCRHKHDHKVGMDPGACITALVGATNALHYLVATQDVALRAAMRAVPGTPVLLYSKNVLILEPPSAQSRSASGSTEAAKAGVTPEEAAAVRAAKKALREQAGAAVSGGAGVGAYSPALPAAAAGLKRRRGSGGGPSGPNPLSIKKPLAPRAPPPSSSAPAPAAAARPASSEAPRTAPAPATSSRAGAEASAASSSGGERRKAARSHHKKRGGTGGAAHTSVAAAAGVPLPSPA